MVSWKATIYWVQFWINETFTARWCHSDEEGTRLLESVFVKVVVVVASSPHRSRTRTWEELASNWTRRYCTHTHTSCMSEKEEASFFEEENFSLPTKAGKTWIGRNFFSSSLAHTKRSSSHQRKEGSESLGRKEGSRRSHHGDHHARTNEEGEGKKMLTSGNEIFTLRVNKQKLKRWNSILESVSDP